VELSEQCMFTRKKLEKIGKNIYLGWVKAGLVLNSSKLVKVLNPRKNCLED
jgi:hypothetical protein